MVDYSQHVSTRKTHQRERTPGRTDEVENSEGGFVFQVDDWKRLDRFLILGSEGGTFYISESNLTKENASATIRLIKEDGLRVVNTVVEVSTAGRAHKNDSALFVLAMCAKLGNEATRRLAYGVLPQIARTGTHLFQFANFVEAFGGWGAGTRRAISRWYNGKPSDKLAYQLLKYRQRDGWSHRDMLRLAHPIPKDEITDAIFKATVKPETIQSLVHENKLPRIYGGYAQAQSMAPDSKVVHDFGLSWEMLPTEWLKDEAVNKQLLLTMPLMATVRQLGKLSANGTIKPLSPETALVIERLTDQEQITRSKIHPMHYLLALKNYTAGQGFRGSLVWKTDSRIVAALNDGFYKSFSNVESTGKAFLLGIDVSSSMRSPTSGSNISCAEAAGAMAMVIARSEPNHYMHGFCSTGGRWSYRSPDQALDGFVDLGISSNDSLDSVMGKVQNRNFGGTDCSLPMLYASAKGLLVDTFIVLTDSATWAGNIKPAQALVSYRQTHNPNAKLVVVAMTGNRFSIADPNDAGMLDVVGFDANVLPVIAEFSR